MVPKRFISLTHLHIYAALNTIIAYRLEKKVIRLLDVGCGNGEMIIILSRELAARHPGIIFEFFGIDVNDSRIQQKGYFDKTISTLTEIIPKISWNERVKITGSDEPWPFPDGHFDLLYSNQVFEHVENHQFTFSEIRRTMTDTGWSINLFPLRHYLFEGHIKIPLAHKFNSWTTTYHWIKWASNLGIGTYSMHKEKGTYNSIHDYSKSKADYMAYQVNYKTTREISVIAKASRLKPSFDFSYLFYKQKIRKMLRMSSIEVYNESDISSAKNSFYFLFLRYVSGITLILRKRDSLLKFTVVRDNFKKGGPIGHPF